MGDALSARESLHVSGFIHETAGTTLPVKISAPKVLSGFIKFVPMLCQCPTGKWMFHIRKDLCHRLQHEGVLQNFAPRDEDTCMLSTEATKSQDINVDAST